MRKMIFAILNIPFLYSCQSPKRDINIPIKSKTEMLTHIADSLYKMKFFFEVISYYDTLIRIEPKNGEFYYRRAYSREKIYQTPSLKASIDDYLKSIELGYKAADSYFNLGLAYIFKNDSTALFYFQNSYKLNPNDPEVIVLINSCKNRLSGKNKHKYDTK